MVSQEISWYNDSETLNGSNSSARDAEAGRHIVKLLGLSVLRMFGPYNPSNVCRI